MKIKNKTGLRLIGGAVVLGVLWYLFLRKKPGEVQPQGSVSPESPGSFVTFAAPWAGPTGGPFVSQYEQGYSEGYLGIPPTVRSDEYLQGYSEGYRAAYAEAH